jgi:cytidylate kinase
MKSYRHPGLDKIVGKQLQIWETRREVQRRRLLEEAGAAENLGPFIAISRLPFSRGDEVAQRVAEKLDWPIFDREIVDFIAENANTLNQFVDSLDEKCRAAMNDWIQTALDGKTLGHLAYLRHLKRVLMTIAMHGNSVILGRGANFVLPSEAGLRVLISSPPRLRIQRLMEDRGLSSSEAAKELRKLDEQRRDFLKTHFLAAGQELDFYDLILNLDQLDVEAAATMVVDAFYTLDRRAVLCPTEDVNLPRS